MKDSIELQCKSCGFAGSFIRVKKKGSRASSVVYSCPKCGTKVEVKK